MTDRAMASLRNYQWPGNIRELGNVIERGVILADIGSDIGNDQLFPHLKDTGDKGEADHPWSLSELADELLERECALADLEEQMIAKAMSKSNGNVTQAAKLLGLSRPALDYRLKKGLPSD